METRLKRRGRTDIKFANKGGMLDLFDNAIKAAWRINDDEYDFICKNINNREMDLFTSEELSFSNAKKIINKTNELIDILNKED